MSRLALLVPNSACALPPAADTTFWVLDSDAAARIVDRHPELAGQLQVLPVDAGSRQDFVADAAFERQRYERLVPLLAARLRRIHAGSEPDLYWERLMGFTLLMHVANCRRVFRAATLAAGLGLQLARRRECSGSDDWTPAGETAYRNYFQYSEEGDERLLQCFERLFPGRLAGTLELPTLAASAAPTPAPPTPEPGSLVARLWQKRRHLVAELAIRLLRRLVSPRVLATQVYWRIEARQRLELRSAGRLRIETLPLALPALPATADEAARALLAEAPAAADDFERFFFASLQRCAPRSWIEALPQRRAQVRRQLGRFPRLRHIANESLDEDSLLLLAEAGERGISTLLCEHNYLQLQYVGNTVWYMLRKVDRYFTLGWSAPDEAKIVPAGSYFRWTDGAPVAPAIDVLYISAVCMVRQPISSAGYSQSGTGNVARYMAMKEAFFAALAPATTRRIYYRDYPAWRRVKLGVHHDDGRFVAAWRQRLAVVDDLGLGDSTALMNRSRIVVTDYLSTAYLQAMLSGVPMLVLFNRESFHLDAAHADFFDDLIEARIFHPDPVAAAHFLEEVMAAPLSWWNSPAVQAARRRFLGRNLGDPERLGSLILGLLREPPTPAAAARP